MSADLNAQRRILRSLGFEFLEAPFEPPAAPSTERTEPAHPRPKAAPSRPPAAEAPVKRPDDPPATMEDLIPAVLSCTRCNLHHLRDHAIPGIGRVGARLFAVADIPFKEENQSGRPLDGPIGEMARKMFGAMKLKPEDLYFTASVKCRPQNGRPPSAIERRACQPYLHRQIQLIRPEAIVLFGADALSSLLPTVAADGLDAARGVWHQWQNIPVTATLSLESIHDNTHLKKVVWGDMQLVQGRLKLA